MLGESILAATVAVQSALDAGGTLGDLAEVAAGGLLVVFAMWWLYFGKPARHGGVTSAVSFVWGYGHLFVFAAAAAVGAGLAVAVDQATHHAEITARGAALAVAVPVGLYLISLWVLHSGIAEPGQRPRGWRFPVVAVLLVAAAALTGSILVVGLVLAGLVARTIGPWAPVEPAGA